MKTAKKPAKKSLPWSPSFHSLLVREAKLMAQIAAHPDANTAGAKWFIDFFRYWRKHCEPEAVTKRATRKA